MTVTTISRPDGRDIEHTNYPTITGFIPIASYNWLDVPNPTILVPGCPPIWSPPSNPQTIAPDTGFDFVDQNADRYPQSPLKPLFASIIQMQPAFDFSSIDIITDRNSLRKLYAFAASDPKLKDFRFGISLFGDEKKTVMFHRMEKMTREVFAEGCFHGYRKGFETQYMRLDEEAKGSRSHYRISEYEFGDLKFLVRSGVDGCIPSPALSQDASEQSVITEKHSGDATSEAKGKSKTEDTSAADKLGTGSLAIILTSRPPIHHSTLLELVTRSKYSKNPFNIATKMPDLYLSQTANFVEAYHHNAGYWNFSGDKTSGKFALEDVKVLPMGKELKDWESENGLILGRYLKVVKEILVIVKSSTSVNGMFEVSYPGCGSELRVEEVDDGEMVVMRDEIRQFFGGRVG
ncbi:MAG: hypothetical protein Q9166_000303 [cf. Caloplaca sp. 2 TL-2023]